MPRSETWSEAARLLGRPAVVLPVVAGIGVFVFLSLRAPQRPKIVDSAPIATQFPSVTPGASPTLGPPPPTQTPLPTPTPDRRALDRDALRKRHLSDIGARLAVYLAALGSYPDSGGSVQSLCRDGNVDAGCKLQGYIDGALLMDPLGPYQYASDGARWTLFAEMEAIQPGDRCTDPLASGLPHPERTYCLTGRAPAPTGTASP